MRNVDIAVTGADGTLQLVLEIKNVPGATAEWVILMRRNLLAHSFLPPAPFFLLVLPDFLYLWTGSSTLDGLAKPDYKIETSEMLAPYLKYNQSLIELSRYGLEMLTVSWLEDILHADLRRDSVDGKLRWIFDSGLYRAITNGSLELEAMT